MLSLRYFPANAAFAFVFGSDLRTARPTALAGEPLFFASRVDAVRAAGYKGLSVAADGAVSVAAN